MKNCGDLRLNNNQEELLDQLLYGCSFAKTGLRSWYNPFRWIKGKEYRKRIDPRKVYIKDGSAFEVKK